MGMRRVLLVSGWAAAVAAAFALGLVLAGGGGDASSPARTQLDDIRARLAARYYRPLPDTVFRLQDVDAIIAALDDPYTEYLEPFAYSELRRQTSASYAGVGLTALPQDDGLVVTAVPPGPAREAGLRPGDVVVAIDGAPTTRLTFERALGHILGPPGTHVVLGVRRGGTALRFRVRRAEINTSAVSSRVLAAAGRRFGYVALRSLASGSSQLLSETLARLERGGADAVVLDLRDNPGGLLDQAVAVASLFLAEGVVVSVEGLHEPRRVYRAQPRGADSRLPLAVLVNRFTASAAEVVAAALHENGRAQLVGENTFGKSTVQSIEPLPNGAALKLTTARYVTPAGADLSRGGLSPDLYAVDDSATRLDEALAAALALVR
jgi:carboxyl-terminal processing protease